MERRDPIRQGMCLSIIQPPVSRSLLFVAIFLPSAIQPLLSHLYAFICDSSFYRLSGFETAEDCPMLRHHRATVYIQIRTQSTYAHWHARPQSSKDKQGQAKSLGDAAAFQTHGRGHDLCFTSTADGFHDDQGVCRCTYVRYQGLWQLSLAHTRGNGIDQSELPPEYTAQFLLEVVIAAATCIAAVPAYEPTTRLRAHDGPLHLRHPYFFVIYLAFHRIEFLARIHRPHHTYAEIHPQVTN